MKPFGPLICIPIIIVFMINAETTAQNHPLKVHELKILQEGYGEQVYFHPEGTCWVTATRGNVYYWKKYKLKSSLDIVPMRRGTVFPEDDELVLGHARYHSKSGDLKSDRLDELKVNLIDRAYGSGGIRVHSPSLANYFETEQVLLNKGQDRLLLALNFRPPRDGAAVQDLMGQYYLVGLFDTATREVIQVLYKGPTSHVKYWSFSGAYISGLTDGLEVWSEADGKPIGLSTQVSALASLYWYSDKELYLCFLNGEVKTLNVVSGEQKLLFTARTPILQMAKVTVQGEEVLATLHQGADLQLWPAGGDDRAPLWQQNFGGKLEGLAVHPSLPHLYLSHYDNTTGPKIHVFELSR